MSTAAASTPQAQYYDGAAAEAVLPLVGEQLGTATGSIDEWSSQEEYAKECASTYTGPFYAMKGYDEGFRIFMTEPTRTTAGPISGPLNG